MITFIVFCKLFFLSLQNYCIRCSCFLSIGICIPLHIGCIHARYRCKLMFTSNTKGILKGKEFKWSSDQWIRVYSCSELHIKVTKKWHCDQSLTNSQDLYTWAIELLLLLHFDHYLFNLAYFNFNLACTVLHVVVLDLVWAVLAVYDITLKFRQFYSFAVHFIYPTDKSCKRRMET